MLTTARIGSPADLRHEIFGHTSYRVELSGENDDLAAQIQAIEPTLKVAGVSDCGPDGFCVATITTESSADLGEKLLSALPGLGYRVRSLGRTQPSLEDVFLAATRRSWDARLPDKPQNGDSRAPLPKV